MSLILRGKRCIVTFHVWFADADLVLGWFVKPKWFEVAGSEEVFHDCC